MGRWNWIALSCQVIGEENENPFNFTYFSPAVGGVETHLDDLCKYFASRKHTVYVRTYKALGTSKRGKTKISRILKRKTSKKTKKKTSKKKRVKKKKSLKSAWQKKFKKLKKRLKKLK